MKKDTIESMLPNEGRRFKVTVSELSLILQKLDGGRPTMFSMYIATDARLAKTGNPYRDEEVLKVSRYVGSLNVNYTNAVNNQLEREGKERDFQAQENWHTKKYDSFNGCVAMKAEGNKKQEYLFFFKKDVNRIGFRINNKKTSAQERAIIEQFLPKYYAPKNQGTDKAIEVQTVKLENIKRIRLNGKIYDVVQ